MHVHYVHSYINSVNHTAKSQVLKHLLCELCVQVDIYKHCSCLFNINPNRGFCCAVADDQTSVFSIFFSLLFISDVYKCFFMFIIDIYKIWIFNQPQIYQYASHLNEKKHNRVCIFIICMCLKLVKKLYIYTCYCVRVVVSSCLDGKGYIYVFTS